MKLFDDRLHFLKSSLFWPLWSANILLRSQFLKYNLPEFLLLGGTALSVVVAARVYLRRIWWERPEIKFTTYDASPALYVGDSYLPEKNSIFLTMPVSSVKRILSEEKLLPVSNRSFNQF